MFLLKNIKSFLSRLLHYHMNFVSLGCAETLNSYHCISKNNKTACYPIQYVGSHNCKQIHTEPVSLYYYVLDNCECVGGSQLVIKKGRFYHDLLSDCKGKPNVFVSDPILLWFNNKLVHVFNYYVVLSEKQNKKPIKKAISLMSHFSWNYYHFLYEVISKFYVIKDVEFSDDYVFLVDSVIKDVPSMHQVLNFFIADERIVWVEQYEKLSIEKLVSVSCPNFIAPNFFNVVRCEFEDVVYCENALTYIRTFILSKCVKDIKTPKRFFIIRKGHKNRQYNETEILDAVIKKGMEPISPELFSFEEQVCLFNNANIIVAASGAALANILFCKEGCRIICLVSDSFNLSIFSTIAAVVGAEMVYIKGTPVLDNFIQSDFRIEQRAVSETIDSFI